MDPCVFLRQINWMEIRVLKCEMDNEATVYFFLRIDHKLFILFQCNY